jgi:hypothetical protein
MKNKNIYNMEEAIKLCSLGWSIIPVAKNKRSLIEWKEFQQRIASREEIRAWFQKWPSANIAVVTGAISNLIVFDIDSKHGRSSKEFQMPVTVWSKTGGGGEHVFFRHPGKHVPNSSGSLFGVGVDIKGDAGYAILPGSFHASGNYYAWLPLHSPQQISMAEIPKWLMQALNSHSRTLSDNK